MTELGDAPPDTPTDSNERGSINRAYLRRTGGIFALGLVGVIGFAITALLVPETLPEVPEVSRTVLLVASLVQPIILVFIAAAFGTRLAPRLGFRSHITARITGVSINRSLVAEAQTAVPAGLGTGVLIVGLDVLFSSAVGSALAPSETATVTTVLASVPLRFLYGGLTEEVLLRWGFMTILVWGGWRLTGRPTQPTRATVWGAILVAAVVFGAGHLPALAAEMPLTSAVIARTVLLNSVGGVVFGWLYWRLSLEAAMVGHAAAHIPLLGAALAAVI